MRLSKSKRAILERHLRNASRLLAAVAAVALVTMWVGKDDRLPEEIQSLIVHLEKLEGSAPTLREFGTHIHALGLNSEPDHWKDFAYQWRIPARDDNKGYVLFGHFAPKREKELRLHEASIRRRDDGDVWAMRYENSPSR